MTSTYWYQEDGACPYCSSFINRVYHTGMCPSVQAVEYYPNGSVKRIEFREQAQPRMPGLHPNSICVSDDFDNSATITISGGKL